MSVEDFTFQLPTLPKVATVDDSDSTLGFKAILVFVVVNLGSKIDEIIYDLGCDCQHVDVTWEPSRESQALWFNNTKYVKIDVM